MNFKEATNLLAVSLEQIAEITGKSYPTVLAYRTGDRIPPPDVMRRLAEFMRQHGQAIVDAANHIGALNNSE
jgi:hypothetical protein